MDIPLVHKVVVSLALNYLAARCCVQ